MAKWNIFLDEEYSSSGREKTSRSRNKKKESKKRRRKRKEEKKKNVYNNVIDEMAFQTETRAEHDLPAEILEAEKKVFSLWVEGLNKEGKPFFIKPKNLPAAKKIFSTRDKIISNPRCRGLLKSNKYFQRIFLWGFRVEKIFATDGTPIEVLVREDGKYDFRYFDFPGWGVKVYQHYPKIQGGAPHIYTFIKRRRDDGKTQKYFVCTSSEKKIKEDVVAIMATEGIE